MIKKLCSVISHSLELLGKDSEAYRKISPDLEKLQQLSTDKLLKKKPQPRSVKNSGKFS
ncbi:MAG: hypothetical protein AB1489_33760 [Acidobacteriota bacterium]